ncbi:MULTISPECIES: efflux RND transporter periplasmic adaptor subunit [unclassified Mesorhizobium]|uniref:efflux RND transporter periplasmic adaptor subunit n=1 Tax=unclassified Mesorhizobium TaxID=325217 RepID=UPI0008F3205D|nr:MULTISPECIES: efflux RND transporter periplasmic adaptor subunit [unclassified Mesorhizobium]RJG44668.1 efflux RND transporter periplasmic adaptor subunit [Mesorhizobium sp. DCY119]SFU03712.1 HlyD family secretion protein [Mesorhizobium sp. YR577]
MDQIVNRPVTETPATVEAALGLDNKGRGRKRRRGWIYALVGLALVAGGGYYMVSGPSSAAVSYTTVPAETGNLVVEVSATGTLQPLTQVDISSELSGVVRSVSAEENQEVRKGDVLAALDTTRLLAQIERAQASVKAAEAKVLDAKTTLKETEQTLARSRQLSARGMVADQTVDTAQAARDRAESAVASADANLAIAAADLKLQQADLAKSTIYAPIDGVILTRSVDPGQTVASSLQAPVLFVIAADLKQMELQAAVDEADIGSVTPGQKARFTVDAFPDRRFDADIRDISFASTTTEGVVTYNARLAVDNAELLLRPGMTATVAIVTREANNIVTVPSAAFRFRPPAADSRRGWSLQNLFMPRMGRPGGGQRQRQVAADGTRTLYVLKDGQPEAVKVKTGSTNGEDTEIVSGISAGDLIITGSQTRN